MEETKTAALSVAEAAHELRLGISYVYLLVKAGRLRAIKVGDRWLVPRSAIAEFLGESEPKQPARCNA